MPRNLLLCGLLIALGLAGMTHLAVAASPVEGPKTDYVSIETPAGGEPMLVVRYPWTMHKKPSIEVRTYVQGEEESVRIRPLHFRHGFMKDEITITVFETQAASASTRTTVDFTRRDIKFTAVGQRNLLGRPAACLTCETEILRPNKTPFPEKSRWALYPFMEPWAVDDETLFLSLPDSTFSAPAKLRVFFLRDDDVVWSEIKHWPGLSKPDAPQPAE